MAKKIIIPILILAMILGLFTVAAGIPSGAEKAHPALVEYAETHPDKSLRVIAFRSHPNSELSAFVHSLGGEIVHDLDMIHAVAVKLPASALKEFAGSQLVRWVSPDGEVESSGQALGKKDNYPPNFYHDTVNVKPVWNMGLTGKGVTLVILDSGVKRGADFNVGVGKKTDAENSRILFTGSFNDNGGTSNSELYVNSAGHGTHVAGIAGGNGAASNGFYVGIAPEVNLIGLQIAGPSGKSYESDVVAAMQWIYDNKATYNIRIVNMSFNSAVESSYHTSAMSAAAEVLWFNGIVVVASAGNKGPAGGYNTVKASPAHDPFIITVGATDEKGTAKLSDDNVAPFSARGNTIDGHYKPEIVAPGKDIISVLASTSDWANLYPDYVIGKDYIRASGTSMSAPMVSGAVALLLQDEPNLTPDQVKYRLLNASSNLSSDGNQFAYLDVYKVVTGTSTGSANTGQTPSQLLWTGSNPINWNSVSWNSVSWNSVSWNSVSWNSVSWNSVSWNSIFLGP